MKILIYGINYFPELTGIGKYTGEMAARLADLGHTVTVLAAPPYYPAWKIEAPYRAFTYAVERPRERLTILRCPVWIPGKITGLKRILHLLSFSIASVPRLIRGAAGRPDVVFVVAPALSCAPLGWLAARLCGASAWLHIQDFEVDAAFELGLLSGARARRFALAIERWLYRRFDVVSTISLRMRALLVSKGITEPDTRLFPNWVDINNIHPMVEPSGMRAEIGISPDQVVCLFSGTLNRKQGLQVLIQTARLLADRRDIVFVIAGVGETRAALQADAAELENVRFLDLQPLEKLNQLLNMADVHLLPQLASAADLVMPSKLTGMLASGRPVIAGAAPGTEVALVVAGRGIVVNPEDAHAFSKAIVTLADDAFARAQFGAAARQYAEEHLGRDRIIDRFIEDISALIGPGPVRNLH